GRPRHRARLHRRPRRVPRLPAAARGAAAGAPGLQRLLRYADRGARDPRRAGHGRWVPHAHAARRPRARTTDRPARGGRRRVPAARRDRMATRAEHRRQRARPGRGRRPGLSVRGARSSPLRGVAARVAQAVAVVVALATVIGACGGSATEPESEPEERSSAGATPGPGSAGTYVALGDSAASGMGIPPEEGTCRRSERAYGPLLAERHGYTLVNRTCAGARVGDVLGTSDVQGPPQIDGLDSDTALVTLMIGANDLGYRSEEHTSELQSRENLVCRLLLEKKKQPLTDSKKM